MAGLVGFFAFIGSLWAFILTGALIDTVVVRYLPSMNPNLIDGFVLAGCFGGWQLVRMKFLDPWIRRHE